MTNHIQTIREALELSIQVNKTSWIGHLTDGDKRKAVKGATRKMEKALSALEKLEGSIVIEGGDGKKYRCYPDGRPAEPIVKDSPDYCKGSTYSYQQTINSIPVMDCTRTAVTLPTHKGNGELIREIEKAIQGCLNCLSSSGKDKRELKPDVIANLLSKCKAALSRSCGKSIWKKYPEEKYPYNERLVLFQPKNRKFYQFLIDPNDTDFERAATEEHKTFFFCYESDLINLINATTPETIERKICTQRPVCK